MSRSRAHAVWLIAVVLLLIGELVLFEFGGSLAQTIQQRQSALSSSRLELENVSRLSTALALLDQLTIDENTATRLEILRHLGLEKNDYDVNIGGRIQHTIGSVIVTERQIKVTADLPYVAALGLADKLYNNGKMNVTGAMLANANPSVPDAEVEVTIKGVLYGLDKKGEH